MSEPLISTSKLGLIRDGDSILHDVSFEIRKGEIVTVVGPNGSGKSSFLKTLIGALRPDEGTVSRRPGIRIGYVPQKLHLDHAFPMSVERFLALGGGTVEERAALAAQMGVASAMKSQVSGLSGGQLQRVLLAQALIGAPDLLILDEAAQGLDQPAVAAFYHVIEDVRRRIGCAVLMVSHDLHVVMSASDRVICLNGHVCCEGAPTVVSAAPEYRALFGYGTEGALALYRHVHDHNHDGGEGHHHHHHHAEADHHV